ncbi:MAG: sugar phosphate isomerase/epimerase family protein [Anaerocolumna sp.]
MTILKNKKISGFADEIDTNIDKQIEVLTELGIHYLELRSANGKGVAEFTLEEARELKNKLDLHGIKVSAIGSPIGKILITEEFTNHLEKLNHIIKIAKIFETEFIRMFSFYIPEGENPDSYRLDVFARMKQMVELAKREDVILLHENEKGIYGDNAQRCEELMKEFYGPHFKCTFDFANFVQCHQEVMEAYTKLKEYVAYIHIKDAKWESGEVVPAGEGDGILPDILKLLEEKQYDGFLSLEPHLYEFSGIKDLEKDGQVRRFADPKEAFSTAYRALENILTK